MESREKKQIQSTAVGTSVLTTERATEQVGTPARVVDQACTLDDVLPLASLRMNEIQKSECRGAAIFEAESANNDQLIQIDVVCPLYHADRFIDQLLGDFQKQVGVDIHATFPITDTGDCDCLIQKIQDAGYDYFLVSPEDFSHSNTRQKAIEEYCTSDLVLTISQDVILLDKNSVFELAKAIDGEVVYAYGKQVCTKKTFEHYTRSKNYGNASYTVTAADISKLQIDAFFASDAFAIYHRPTFLALHGYDYVPMMMNEDMYYAKKVLEHGYKKAYVATAIVEHSHRFRLKQLYQRYYETGVWFAEHQEFAAYKVTNSGIHLAWFVLKQALKDINIPVLFRWLPDMTARYLGMRDGRKKKHERDKKRRCRL